MKHSNISVFIPHIGCPNMCSFCNQRTISGIQKAPSAFEVREICQKAFSEVSSRSETEIAFFGGSFTAIDRSYMLELLQAVQEFIGDDGFKGIRISTRPDCINSEILDLLKKYKVTSIELGAQSMCNHVLLANDRGHTAEDVENAGRLIRVFGFELGLQMMIGLYKSTPDDELRTFDNIMSIKPDTLRIYPVVILKGTRLGELYESGEYEPFDFRKAVELCSLFMEKSEENGVRVIKAGLHASEFVEKDLLGGFYHPAFRELCESEIYKKKIKSLIGENCSYALISVPNRNLSMAIGQKRSNIEFFSSIGTQLRIISDKLQTESLKLIERR